MPHLSPMNWLMAILSFWVIISLMMSSNWWMQSNLFSCPKLSSSIYSSNSWNWYMSWPS